MKKIGLVLLQFIFVISIYCQNKVDTVIYFRHFKGDLIKLELENINHKKYADSISYIVPVYFRLNIKNKIDSIKITTNNVDLRGEIENFIKDISKKFNNIEKLNLEKSNIFPLYDYNIKLIIMSPLAIDYVKKYDLSACNYMFAKGNYFLEKNDIYNTLKYYNESEALFYFRETTSKIGLTGILMGVSLLDIYINKGIAYNKINLNNKACEEFKKAIDNAPKDSKNLNDIIDFVKNNCKNNLP